MVPIAELWIPTCNRTPLVRSQTRTQRPPSLCIPDPEHCQGAFTNRFLGSLLTTGWGLLSNCCCQVGEEGRDSGCSVMQSQGGIHREESMWAAGPSGAWPSSRALVLVNTSLSYMPHPATSACLTPWPLTSSPCQFYSVPWLQSPGFQIEGLLLREVGRSHLVTLCCYCYY